MLNRSRMFAFAVVALAGSSASLSAQECVGLPAAAPGTFSYGFGGTDGATGEGLHVSARNGSYGFELRRTSLDQFALADRVKTWGARASRQLTAGGSLCATAGTSWTSYTAAWNYITRQHPDGRITEELTLAGEFDAVRLPVGLSLGNSFAAGPFRFYPHVGTALVLDYERLRDIGTDALESRTGAALAGEVGLGIRVGRVMLRSSLSDMLGDPEHALSGTHNWAHLAVSLGWVF